MGKGKVNNNFFIVTVIIFILLCLSLINIKFISSYKPVLGAHSEITNDKSDFWGDFTSINPNYIPGLIENGDIDKAKEVNPNYLGGL